MKEITRQLKRSVTDHESSFNINAKWRPLFHLHPICGWMNDPNGLCEFSGIHHIFFQYTPFGTKPGLNFWGHFSTKDFLHYEYHEPFLCCDEQFDCHGVYSGSALAEDDGLTFFYTGNVKHMGDYDYISAGREHNTVSVTLKDNDFSEAQKHLLMTNNDYPSDDSCHVRDPKVFKDGDEYHMALGARRRDDVGEVLLFRSSDKENWTLEGRITSPQRLGYMWECPDIFTLGGKRFLSICPQGVTASGYKFNNIYQSGYTELCGDTASGYKTGEFIEYDCGFDFYAPQTYVDSKGRRILIGWFGLPDIDYKNPTDKLGWIHCLTVPRELTEKGGRILQMPIAEIDALRKNERRYTVNSQVTISGMSTFDCVTEFADDQTDKFEMKIADVSIEYKDGIFSLLPGESGYGRKERHTELDELKNIRILCDTSTLEIFINNGERVFSTRFYPRDKVFDITMSAQDAKARFWDMDAFEYEVTK